MIGETTTIEEMTDTDLISRGTMIVLDGMKGKRDTLIEEGMTTIDATLTTRVGTLHTEMTNTIDVTTKEVETTKITTVMKSLIGITTEEMMIGEETIGTGIIGNERVY